MKKTLPVVFLASIFGLNVTIAQEKDLKTSLEVLKENEARILSELEQLTLDLKQVQNEIAVIEKEIDRRERLKFVESIGDDEGAPANITGTRL